jgi:hypothetical protein
MDGLSAGDWFTIVGGVVSIVAFVVSLWIWLEARAKQHELIGVIRSVRDVAGNVLWEMQSIAVEDDETRLRQAERALGLTSAIYTMTSKYVPGISIFPGTELGMLVDRGVIIPNTILWTFESSRSTTEVWLVTPDLEPDMSDSTTGNLVARNLRGGKRYTYFYPNSLAVGDVLEERLLVNVGAAQSAKRREQVCFMRLGDDYDDSLFRLGNSIFLFNGSPGQVRPRGFQEIVLTKIARRGSYWQQYDPLQAEDLCRDLLAKLQQDE